MAASWEIAPDSEITTETDLLTSPRNHLNLSFADWIFTYPRDWLRPDLIAGLTTAAVVIPKAMAYATIAGLPVQVGLYTAFVPMMIYAVLGKAADAFGIQHAFVIPLICYLFIAYYGVWGHKPTRTA